MNAGLSLHEKLQSNIFSSKISGTFVLTCHTPQTIVSVCSLTKWQDTHDNFVVIKTLDWRNNLVVFRSSTVGA